jgi:triacylglycerol lipase
MLKEYFTTVLEGPWKTAGEDVQYKIINKVLYLAGSNSFTDWKHNFDFPIEPYKKMPIVWYAHRGFISAWKSARDKILFDTKNNSVHTIVGYSFGGALATLAHEDYIFNYGDGINTYTFGSPRVVWDSSGIKSRFDKLIRVKVNGDIVTHLPFAFLGFNHVGKCITYGPKSFPRIMKHIPREYLAQLDNEYTHE